MLPQCPAQTCFNRRRLCGGNRISSNEIKIRRRLRRGNTIPKSGGVESVKGSNSKGVGGENKGRET